MIRNWLSNLLPDPINPKYIDTEVLDDCLNAAQGSHPNEFLALLVATHSSELKFASQQPSIEDEYVITSYYVIPGTEVSPSSASIKQINVPINETVVGSFHSHPNGVTRPSDEDTVMFQKYPVNIIAGTPYNQANWKAYDQSSSERDLKQIETDGLEMSDKWKHEFEQLQHSLY